ncbi:hypothetical protein I7I50_08289 [Histoplasma capsulatum G186AR]|nr:hypothetical protein I7I52_05805 [Histoplasma capsulatum]QSS73499.1 hypothetical protein I7I50_08289 [Histoplasma capsulatum G186AR]
MLAATRRGAACYEARNNSSKKKKRKRNRMSLEYSPASSKINDWLCFRGAPYVPVDNRPLPGPTSVHKPQLDMVQIKG